MSPAQRRERFGSRSPRGRDWPPTGYPLPLSSSFLSRRVLRSGVHCPSQRHRSPPYVAPDEWRRSPHGAFENEQRHPAPDTFHRADDDFVTVALRNHGGPTSLRHWQQLEEERAREEARLTGLLKLHRPVLTTPTEDGISSERTGTWPCPASKEALTRRVRKAKESSKKSGTGSAGISLRRCPSLQNTRDTTLQRQAATMKSLENTGVLAPEKRWCIATSLSLPSLERRQSAGKLDETQSYTARQKPDSLDVDEVSFLGEGVSAGLHGKVLTCVSHADQDLMTVPKDVNKKFQTSSHLMKKMGMVGKPVHERRHRGVSRGKWSSRGEPGVHESVLGKHGHLAGGKDLRGCCHVGFAPPSLSRNSEHIARSSQLKMIEQNFETGVGRIQFKEQSESTSCPHEREHPRGYDVPEEPAKYRQGMITRAPRFLPEPPSQCRLTIHRMPPGLSIPSTTKRTIDGQGLASGAASASLSRSHCRGMDNPDNGSDRESSFAVKGWRSLTPLSGSYSQSVGTDAAQGLRGPTVGAGMDRMRLSREYVVETLSREPRCGGLQAALRLLGSLEPLSGARHTGGASDAVGEEHLTRDGEALLGARIEDAGKAASSYTQISSRTGESLVALARGLSGQLPSPKQDMKGGEGREAWNSLERRGVWRADGPGEREKHPLPDAFLVSWLCLCTQDPLLQVPYQRQLLELTPDDYVFAPRGYYVSTNLAHRGAEYEALADAPSTALSKGTQKGGNSHTCSAPGNHNQSDTLPRGDSRPPSANPGDQRGNARRQSPETGRTWALSFSPALFPVTACRKQNIWEPQRETFQLVVRIGELKFSRRMGSDLRTAPGIFLCYSVPVAVPALLAKEKTIPAPSNLNSKQPETAGRPKVTLSEPLVEQELVVARPHTHNSLTFVFDKVSSHSLSLGVGSPPTTRFLRRTARAFHSKLGTAAHTSEERPDVATGHRPLPVLLDRETSASLLLQQPLRFLICADVDEFSLCRREKTFTTSTPKTVFGLKQGDAPHTASKQTVESSVEIASPGAYTNAGNVRSCSSQTALLKNWGWTHSFPAAGVRVVAVGLCSTWNAALLKGAREGSAPLTIRVYELRAAISLSSAFDLSRAEASKAGAGGRGRLTTRNIAESLRRRKEELLVGTIRLHVAGGHRGSPRKFWRSDLARESQHDVPKIQEGQPKDGQKGTREKTDQLGEKEVHLRQGEHCGLDTRQKGRKPLCTGRLQRGGTTHEILESKQGRMEDSGEQPVNKYEKEDCSDRPGNAAKDELKMCSVSSRAQTSKSLAGSAHPPIIPSSGVPQHSSSLNSEERHVESPPVHTSETKKKAYSQLQAWRTAVETVETAAEKDCLRQGRKRIYLRQREDHANPNIALPQDGSDTVAIAMTRSDATVLPHHEELYLFPKEEAPPPPTPLVPPIPHAAPPDPAHSDKETVATNITECLQAGRLTRVA